MLPRVIIHNAISLDGRVTGFPVDMGAYYEIAGFWQEDATLVGSGTMLQGAGMEEVPPETEEDLQEPVVDEEKAILALVDSGGKIRFWHFLRNSGFWGRMVALCSESTPKEYLEYLNKRHIEYIIAGKVKVNLCKALEELNSRYKVETVRVDSGGTLNGLLLKACLVTDISVLVHPFAVGTDEQTPLMKIPGVTNPQMLHLAHVGKQRDLVWLRYEVLK